MGHGLLQHVESVLYVRDHLVRLRFEDGVEGEVDLRDVIGDFTGPLAPLADPAFVAHVRVNDQGTITWPGELDLDPVVLYCAVKRIPVPSYETAGSAGPRRRRRAATRRKGQARPKARGAVARRRRTGS